MHPAILVSKTARERISHAIRYFAPDLTSVELVRLFAGRATPAQIRGWRLGRNGAPKWAVEMLAYALKERARNDLETAARLIPGLGHGGHMGADRLHHWRLERALAREKEKAPD